jgi:DNA polymerase I-like protein with 3'-5' exonuclease and polymerase domains
LFGAGDAKLGQTAGQRGKGKILREKLMVAYPGYETMLQNIHNQWESNANEYGRGFVLGLDGRRIFCERFKALNALLQTFEAIVCKAATVEAMRMIREENLDAKLVAFYHDEINTDCADADAERVSEILEYALGDFITEKYSLNLQMGGSAQTGNDWFAVH